MLGDPLGTVRHEHIPIQLAAEGSCYYGVWVPIVPHSDHISDAVVIAGGAVFGQLLLSHLARVTTRALGHTDEPH